MTSPHPRCFVSYAHEATDPDRAAHQRRVTQLVEDLRNNGIDARFDRSVPSTPPEGWPAWMEENVRNSQFVLVVATETYQRRYDLNEKPGTGLGASWEGAILRQELYEAATRNEKFAAIIFDDNDRQFIPQPLRGHTYYSYPSNRIGLLRWLTGQPAYVPRAIGAAPVLPPDP